jgi:N-acetylmuramoyl-L-alanine amidase
VFFWINPFFWLMKKELTMIHEFIADKKAVANGDTSAFAAMILAAAFPGQTLPLTNPFFYSPIKRRLLMLSKLNNPKMGYFSRLLLLPLLTVLFFAFVIKTKEHSVPYFNTTLDKEYVIVIDAGHGMQNGTVNGSKAADGYSEDEFALSLAQKVASLNKNEKLKIILTRTKEQFIPLKERSEFTAQQNPDLFISLHAAYAPKIKAGNSYIENPANGIEAFISSKNPIWQPQSNLLGTTLLQEISSIITPNRGVKTRDRGIWVLDQSTCPAVLLECGFLTNKKDLKIIKDETKQDAIAIAILRGIENYLIKNENPATSEKNYSASQSQFKLSATEIKKDTLPVKQDNNEALFTDTEKDAAYPGGSKAFNDYCFSYLKKHYSTLSNDEKSRNNNCQVRFIVEKNGTISNIEVITNTNSKLAEYCVSLLKQSGAWQPALQNGIPVRKLVTRNISFFDEHLMASYDERNAKKEKNEEEKNYSYLNKYELYLIDGKEVTQNDIKNYLATKEKNGEPISINAYDGNSGKIRYGNKGKNGVLEITTSNGKPTVAISTEKFNILYADVENPLRIAVSDVPDQQLKVTISQGSIEKKGELYVAENLKPGEAVITVTYTYKSGKVISDQIRYKVISTSESISYKPVPSIAGSKGGRIDVTKFKTAGKIDVFSIADEDAIISSYTVYFTGKGFEGKPGLVPNVKGNQFSKKVIELLERAAAGTTIVFDEIKVQTKSGEMRAPPIVFNLN